MMQQHCMRCRNNGAGLEESYVNINATSVHMPSASSMSMSVMRDRESSHADVSSHVKKIQRLHTISESITASATASLPAMCPECLQLLTQMLEKSDARARQEKKALSTFIASVPKPGRSTKPQAFPISTPPPHIDLVDPLITSMQDERVAIHLELQKLQDELSAIEQEEAEMWTAINDKLMAVGDAHDARDASVAKLLEMESRLHITRRMNVWNDTFYIWHKGPFGTINGFCLGRLPRHHIDWHEINAAWGDVALVVQLLAEATGITFRDYQVVPLGSMSKILRLHPSPSMEYSLHGGDADNFVESPFNLGLAALLQCIAHIADFAAAADATFRLPYTIGRKSADVGGLSLLFLRDEEAWTKACKSVLTNLKWLLAWVSKASTGPAVDGSRSPPKASPPAASDLGRG